LNGVWKFQLCPTVDFALRLRREGSRGGQTLAGEIVVPGHWQLLKKTTDAPIYTNIKYIIPVDPPKVPEKNPCGLYKTTFSVPTNWAERQLRIKFEGVDSCFYVWLNDVLIGFSKDSRLPAEFDISSHVNAIGSNTLEVLVIRYSDASFLEDQDMWNLSGIFRDVSLLSPPAPLSVSDISWRSSQREGTDDFYLHVGAKVTWDAATIGSAAATQAWTVQFDIYHEGVLVKSVTEESLVLNEFTSPSSIPVANSVRPVIFSQTTMKDGKQQQTPSRSGVYSNRYIVKVIILFALSSFLFLSQVYLMKVHHRIIRAVW
jgi:beta-galactosidase/beta-glucuronidase